MYAAQMLELHALTQDNSIFEIIPNFGRVFFIQGKDGRIWLNRPMNEFETALNICQGGENILAFSGRFGSHTLVVYEVTSSESAMAFWLTNQDAEKVGFKAYYNHKLNEWAITSYPNSYYDKALNAWVNG